MLYDVLHRDTDKIAGGQVWRLVPSAVVQDGGVAGTVFNLVILAIMTTVATAYWGAGRTWTVFWFGAILSRLAVLAVNPVGGGNSMATFVVATALTSSVLVRARDGDPGIGFAIVVLVCVAVLVVAQNYHALACAIGLVLGLLPGLRPIRRPPEQVVTPSRTR